MNRVGGFATWSTDEKIVRFDITIYQVLRMDRFYS